jgi:hypothetical protein
MPACRQTGNSHDRNFIFNFSWRLLIMAISSVYHLFLNAEWHSQDWKISFLIGLSANHAHLICDILRVR